MKTGRGKIRKMPQSNTRTITIPSKVATDSAFPFEDGERVIVEINDNRLIITKNRAIRIEELRSVPNETNRK